MGYITAGAVLLVRRTKQKVFPVPLVQEDKRGHRDHRGKMALRGHRGPGEKMALGGHRGRGEKMALVDRSGCDEKMVFRAPKATKAILGPE